MYSDQSVIDVKGIGGRLNNERETDRNTRGGEMTGKTGKGGD